MEEDSAHTIQIRIAMGYDMKYVYPILEEMERSAKARGTGIARRTPQSLCQKIYEGKAVIAIAVRAGDEAWEEWAGFSYIESWSNGEFVSNSGLIVNPAYRQEGVAKAIKDEIFALSRRRYPRAQIFSITTGAAVMKMNHQLGFAPVTYPEITQEPRFWDQCRHCVNHAILESNQRKVCLCTAMLYTPGKEVSLAKDAVFAGRRKDGSAEMIGIVFQNEN